MKRYKQVILSNFFVAISDSANGAGRQSSHRHLVEANLDIEARGDRTLCTEVLQGAYRYEVLTNNLLMDVCPICSAILSRRISNMPIERRVSSNTSELVEDIIPEAQMALSFVAKESRGEAEEEESSEQFELFF